MPALINYQPTYQKVSHLYETVISSKQEQKPLWDNDKVLSTNVGVSSLIDMLFDNADSGVNEDAIISLRQISALENNWDEEGAIAPSPVTLIRSGALIASLNRIQQQIFNVVPGFYGEIVIDIRNENKSIEVLFYPNKSKYVTFDLSNNTAQSGVFTDEVLPEILLWLKNHQNAA